MRFLWLPTQNPHHNLAVEAYLLQRCNEDVFMLWQNDNSIIIGRHQNTLAEINYEYVQQEHIVVARRLTGGGAVFHDLGNLNFSFIQNIQTGDREINFTKYLQPVVDALHALGVDAAFSGRNDLVIGEKKISGNAMAFYGNRVLEHGTLLFSTLQNRLAQALKVDPAKFEDKAVKSVRSRVTNISEHLPHPMTVMEFKDYLMDFILKQNRMQELDELTSDELAAIAELEEKQFATWEWNYGQSPKYAYNRTPKPRRAGRPPARHAPYPRGYRRKTQKPPCRRLLQQRDRRGVDKNPDRLITCLSGTASYLTRRRCPSTIWSAF